MKSRLDTSGFAPTGPPICKPAIVQAFRRFLFSLIALIAFTAVPAFAQTLLEQANALEKLAREKKFQQGVNLCRTIGNHYSGGVASEPDPLIQEYYLQVRAELQQNFAAEMSKANRETELVTALQCWSDYFDWLSGLPKEKRVEVLRKRENKVFAAVAAYGNIAVLLDKPATALEQYEQLDAECFGAQGMNLWLWALLHPAYQPPISNKIFNCEQAVLKGRIADEKSSSHWDTFRKRLKQMIDLNLPHLTCHETFSGKLEAAYAQLGPPRRQ